MIESTTTAVCKPGLNDLPYFAKETGNDRWIVEDVFPGMQNGYFVESGCSNGIDLSACYTLEKHLGWKGLCIEPNTFFYEQAIRSRSNVMNVALGDTADKEVDFYECKNGYLSGVTAILDVARSCLPDGHINKHTTHGARAITKVTMKTLRQVLDSAHAPKTIHYAAFDMEGAEEPTLRAFFSDTPNPYTILALSIEGRACSELMKTNDYLEVLNPFNTQSPWEHYFLHSSISPSFLNDAAQ